MRYTEKKVTFDKLGEMLIIEGNLTQIVKLCIINMGSEASHPIGSTEVYKMNAATIPAGVQIDTSKSIIKISKAKIEELSQAITATPASQDGFELIVKIVSEDQMITFFRVGILRKNPGTNGSYNFEPVRPAEIFTQ